MWIGRWVFDDRLRPPRSGQLSHACARTQRSPRRRGARSRRRSARAPPTFPRSPLRGLSAHRARARPRPRGATSSRAPARRLTAPLPSRRQWSVPGPLRAARRPSVRGVCPLRAFEGRARRACGGDLRTAGARFVVCFGEGGSGCPGRPPSAEGSRTRRAADPSRRRLRGGRPGRAQLSASAATGVRRGAENLQISPLLSRRSMTAFLDRRKHICHSHPRSRTARAGPPRPLHAYER